MWNEIAEHISQATGTSFKVRDHRPVGGGCINQSYRISERNQTYFLKVNSASEYEMFDAEALGLQEMDDTQTVRIPKPICWGTTDETAYLVMEWLDIGGHGGFDVWYTMGQQLAEMHRKGVAKKFGWHRDNTIGLTPQKNPWQEQWADFFAENRIGYQLDLANQQSGNYPDTNNIIDKVRELLADHNPQPCLVHGDLWGGNAEVTTAGEPVILDPATYYGDREVDIALSELFGGFPGAFYQGYNATWELDAGYKHRKELYNLYHILNHFNLFGGGYGSQARQIMDRLMQT